MVGGWPPFRLGGKTEALLPRNEAQVYDDDGSASENTFFEPYDLGRTQCRGVDRLGLLCGARSGCLGAFYTGTRSAGHHLGTAVDRAALVPVVLVCLYCRSDG